MLRRVATKNALALAAPAVASRSYNWAMFTNAERRPQLSQEERDKVVIDQTQWPEEFKNHDPQDP